MENLFFLVMAAILLAVSVYFLISYLKGKHPVNSYLTHFSGEPLAAHTIDHRLTMVDLFCCTRAIARQVPAAGSEILSRCQRHDV
ncbi:TPA: small membrane protein [Escherichia coli]|nr:small membrane protein [Escherichia coli]